MQRLEVSCAVRPIHGSLGAKGLIYAVACCQQLIDVLIFAVGRDSRVCICYPTNYTFPPNTNVYIYLIMYATFFYPSLFQMMSNNA
jgi:hypothetical protein